VPAGICIWTTNHGGRSRVKRHGGLGCSRPAERQPGLGRPTLERPDRRRRPGRPRIQNCGAPATDASVWYSYTPSSDETIIVDVSNSTYSAGVIVASGAPGNLSLVSCGPRTIAANLTAGTPYFILAFNDQFDGGGNGGTLNLSVTLGPPAPKVDVIVDRVGLVNKRGSVSLRGVYICSDADFVSINGELTQGESNGGFSFSISGRCDGKLHSWAAGVVGPNAKFTVGRSASMTFGFACGRFECADRYREQTVRLRAR